MKTSKNQHGFAVLETLLIFATLVIIGFVGWYVWNTKKATDSTYSTRNTSTEIEQKISTKQYVNKDYGFSFDYPETWTLTTDLKDLGRGQDEGDIVVSSPSGTKVHFGPNLGGKGGDCWDQQTSSYTTRTCSTFTTLTAEKLSGNTPEKPIYYFHASLKESSEQGGETKFYVFISNNDYFPTNPGGSKLGSVSGNHGDVDANYGAVTVYIEGKDDSKNTSKAFFETHEVKEATPVLKSFRLL